jgi:hypothetical protein
VLSFEEPPRPLKELLSRGCLGVHGRFDRQACLAGLRGLLGPLASQLALVEAGNGAVLLGVEKLVEAAKAGRGVAAGSELEGALVNLNTRRALYGAMVGPELARLFSGAGELQKISRLLAELELGVKVELMLTVQLDGPVTATMLKSQAEELLRGLVDELHEKLRGSPRAKETKELFEDLYDGLELKTSGASIIGRLSLPTGRLIQIFTSGLWQEITAAFKK